MNDQIKKEISELMGQDFPTSMVVRLASYVEGKMGDSKNPEICEHGVVRTYCFNCHGLKEKFGLKIEMFNKHHYVRLKDVENLFTHLTTNRDE